MQNLLLEKVEYKTEKTSFGIWRSYLYPTGARFSEFKSHTEVFGLPLVHYTNGICPETGKRILAHGVLAVGRLAYGIVAIGHASCGIIAIGQLAVSLLFGLGQAAFGLVAVGQFAGGILFGLGQLATGIVVVAQFGVGTYVLAQLGFGKHVWSMGRADPEAVEFFKALYGKIADAAGLVP